MKRNPEFALKELHHVPYLLPIGQAMTDFKKGIRITSVGAFLWNLLEEDISEEALFDKLMAEYEASKEDEAAFRDDLHQFLMLLDKNEMLLPHTEKISLFPIAQRLSIADLLIDFHGPSEALSDYMLDFCVDSSPEETADFSICLSFQRPAEHKNGKLILRNNQLMLIDHQDCYVVLMPGCKSIYEMHIEKNTASPSPRTIIFCSNQIDLPMKEELFAAMRISFLYNALAHDRIMLHSSSIYYAEKAWLFSAPSGTGKSTHAMLWKEAYGAPMLNGDLNMIGLKDKEPVIYGTPWCGTSGVYDTACHPLGGIFLLKRDETDFAEYLPCEQQQLSVLLRCISPSFTKEQLDAHVRLIEKIADQILICRLHCTPTLDAPKASKAAMDQYLG